MLLLLSEEQNQTKSLSSGRNPLEQAMHGSRPSSQPTPKCNTMGSRSPLSISEEEGISDWRRTDCNGDDGEGCFRSEKGSKSMAARWLYEYHYVVLLLTRDSTES